MAAKDSDTKPDARRSCFFTACITLFSFAAFLRLLLLVPCTASAPAVRQPYDRRLGRRLCPLQRRFLCTCAGALSGPAPHRAKHLWLCSALRLPTAGQSYSLCQQRLSGQHLSPRGGHCL